MVSSLRKERSLTYYDELAVKGLQLAANDAQRGLLGAEKPQQLKENVRSLVGDLDHHAIPIPIRAKRPRRS